MNSRAGVVPWACPATDTRRLVMRSPAQRSFRRVHRVTFRALAVALVAVVGVSGAATPAAAAPPPPEPFPSCKELLAPAAPALFSSPVVEEPPITLVATWDPAIKIIVHDNPVKNCRWTAVYGKVIINYTLAYVTPVER